MKAKRLDRFIARLPPEAPLAHRRSHSTLALGNRLALWIWKFGGLRVTQNKASLTWLWISSSRSKNSRKTTPSWSGIRSAWEARQETANLPQNQIRKIMAMV